MPPEPPVAAPPVTAAAPAPAHDLWPGGYGDYRFGMTRAEVKAVTSCQPYRDFSSNPDFECPNLVVDGKTRNVSFHFDAEGRLTAVQLWFAEYAQLPEAVQAFLDVNEHFRLHFGAPAAPPNAAALATNMLRALPPKPASIVMQPPSENVPRDVVVWCHIALIANAGYYMMVYYVYPPTAPSHVRPAATSPR